MKPTISSNLVFDSVDYAAFGGSSSRGSSGGGGGGGGRSSSSQSRGASVRARQERERKKREAAAAAAAKKAHEEAQRRAEQEAAQRRAEERRRKEREMQAAIAAAEKAEKERQEREAAAQRVAEEKARKEREAAAQRAAEEKARKEREKQAAISAANRNEQELRSTKAATTDQHSTNRIVHLEPLNESMGIGEYTTESFEEVYAREGNSMFALAANDVSDSQIQNILAAQKSAANSQQGDQSNNSIYNGVKPSTTTTLINTGAAIVDDITKFSKNPTSYSTPASRLDQLAKAKEKVEDNGAIGAAQTVANESLTKVIVKAVMEAIPHLRLFKASKGLEEAVNLATGTALEQTGVTSAFEDIVADGVIATGEAAYDAGSTITKPISKEFDSQSNNVKSNIIDGSAIRLGF